jgi:uncharacterized caspase-like protein
MLFRLILCLCLVLPLSALAERRVALVMADEEYRHLRPLGTPVRDALAVEDLLKGLGFEVTVETDRDLRRSRRALEDFAEDYAGADVALVYYAGHGVEVGGVNYLLPVDAEAGSAAGIAATGLPLAELQEVLARVAPVAIVLLDACREDPFDGGGEGGGEGRGAAALEDADAPPPRPGLGRVGRADGVLFAFSAAPGEVASDGAGDHSPFAEALLRHFATPGVEVRTALTLVQQDVYDRSRGAQLPYVESGLPRLFFAAATAELDERERLLIAMADLPPDLRDQVQALAAERDMPLAPLFGAVFSADLAGQGADQRAAALVEAAEAFLRFREQLRQLSPDDPEVAELRARAEEALSLGEYDAARAALAQAAKIDGDARDALRDNYRARTLSQAQTIALSAQAARADLDYPGALADLAGALALYAEVEGPDLPAADRAAYSDLLWDRGDLFRMTGNSQKALAAYQDWLTLAAARVAEDPGNPDWARNLGVAQINVGDMLLARGQIAGAGAAFAAAHAIAQDLAARPDAPLKWRHDLFVSTSKLADLAAMRGDLTGALRLHEAGLAVLEGLAQDFPERREVPRDIAVAHERLGDLRLKAGDVAGAKADFRLAVGTRQALIAAEPDKPQWRAELAMAQQKMADALMAEGDREGALDLFRSAEATAAALWQKDPLNARLKRDWSSARISLGDALKAAGDVQAAREAFGGALVLRQEMVRDDPGNLDAQRDLSLAHERLGTLALLQDDTATAAAEFAAALEIARRVAAVSPGSAEAQRDLSIAVDRLGDLAVKQGDFAGAVGMYGESYAIARALAEAEPDNAERQYDLVASLVRMSFFDPQGRALLEEARAILLDLKAKGRMDFAHTGWLGLVEQQLADMP